MERQIQRGKQWLEDLLRLMGIPAAVKIEMVKAAGGESESFWLTIDETTLTLDRVQCLIGQKGETIDAIQYLANALVNIGVEPEERRAFTVELNGYRARRQAELLALAQQVAQQVRETGREVEMKALSSAERRQVHTILQDSEDLTTESRGQEPDRRLVVRLR